jgi:hypothetical protein
MSPLSPTNDINKLAFVEADAKFSPSGELTIFFFDAGDDLGNLSLLLVFAE